MNRTDTIQLPRIVATASAPLTPQVRRPWRAVAVVVMFAVALAAVVAVGRSLAWTEQPATSPPVHVTDLDPDALADIADLASQHGGTDAGLITEPAR